MAPMVCDGVGAESCHERCPGYVPNMRLPAVCKPMHTPGDKTGPDVKGSYVGMFASRRLPCAGRTHQLRRHAAMIGHPILGDRRYHHGWAAEKRRLAQLDALAEGSDADSQEEQQQQQQQQQQHGNGIVASAQEAASGSSGCDLNGEQAAADGMDERSNAAESADAQCHGGGASAHAEGDSTAAAGSGGNGHLCLWAVQIQLQHPVTLEDLDVCIPEPAAYAALRAVHTAD